MTGKDAIKSALLAKQQLWNWYLGDLSDADLLVRPAAGANHSAWQMGHVLVGEVFLIQEQVPEAAYPALPTNFVEQHDKKTAALDSAQDFHPKATYQDLFAKVRNTTITTLEKLSDADLDRPCTGQMATFAPRLGDMFLLVSNHTLMHAGQFTVVRRKLGKPVLF